MIFKGLSHAKCDSPFLYKIVIARGAKVKVETSSQ